MKTEKNTGQIMRGFRSGSLTTPQVPGTAIGTIAATITWILFSWQGFFWFILALNVILMTIRVCCSTYMRVWRSATFLFSCRDLLRFILCAIESCIAKFMCYSTPKRPARPKLRVVLDLDRTLIYTPPKDQQSVDKHMEEVVRYDIECCCCGDCCTCCCVQGRRRRSFYVRPGVRQFLHDFHEQVDFFVFTAGNQPYADPILDEMDPDKKYFKKRFYYRHCTTVRFEKSSGEGTSELPLKDLKICLRDSSSCCKTCPDDSMNLGRIVLVDDRPISFLLHPENGILVPPFSGPGTVSTNADGIAIFDKMEKGDQILMGDMYDTLIALIKSDSQGNDVRDYLVEKRRQDLRKIAANSEHYSTRLSDEFASVAEQIRQASAALKTKLKKKQWASITSINRPSTPNHNNSNSNPKP